MSKYPNRPTFPKRAIVTAGMPYGNKSLHFGHIGGVFVQADTYARFLRDRIGKDNVIFVSGTDCYGSPIAEGYRVKVEKEGFEGTIEDYVNSNHQSQKKTLDDYEISLNIYGASGLGDTKPIHAQVTKEIIEGLYNNGWLDKLVTRQFYDEKAGCFLNGRQVIGKCPINGCSSEKGYADECDLGHQYMPEDLINPKSTLTGDTPIMKDVVNWYFRLTDFDEILKKYVNSIQYKDNVRPLVPITMRETLAEPIIYVIRNYLDAYNEVKNQLPKHETLIEEKKNSFQLTFEKLADREKACEILTANNIRYRTGKTLVPLRLSGNIEWGVPCPELEGIKDLTVWVWPESLWAPISFTKAYLKRIGKDDEEWKDYWCNRDAEVFQFIGQDNIYFYGIAQQAMFMALQGKDNLSITPENGQLTLSTLAANHHILFLDKKASSSGSVKPPMAADLLEYYTAEQLRAHFLGLALDQKSVSFMPKPLNPNANPKEQDPVLKEGNLFTNVLNRLARSCFYTVQKYYDGVLPEGEVSEAVKQDAIKACLDYEAAMYKIDTHKCMDLLDSYIRLGNKYWARNIAQADREENDELRKQTLIDCFHIVRTCLLLTHPITPKGTDMVREYLGASEEIYNWEYFDEPLNKFIEEGKPFKVLEPKVDFYVKHPSQFEEGR